ncbi:MAG: hypothetical protein E7410_06160 [Ruminococcaceae bacterium]|nr:hypothetical protein [Oscillospiraceae bacterium]
MNNRFLEEYKRADKICRDIYDSETGISNYIDLMRDAKNYASQSIDDWDEVLKRLLSLRHIRNKLSHEVGTLDMELCTEDDILWLEGFGASLLNMTDPLARHYRAFEKAKRKRPVPDQSAFEKKKPEFKTEHKKTEPVYKTTSTYKRKKRIPVVFRMLGFFALLLLALYLLMELYKIIGA